MDTPLRAIRPERPKTSYLSLFNITNLRMNSYATLLRPRQWIKNLFVLIGIVFSGQYHTPPLLIDALILLASFTLASGSVYIFNDLMDAEADSSHPKKRMRPIASGKISKRSANLFLLVTISVSIASAFFVSIPAVAIIISYFLMNVAYSIRLKYIPILDVFTISAGFILRVLIGTYGLAITPSNWLILCTFMLTLFLGFSKRRAELQLTGDSNESRNVLKYYRQRFLDHAMTVTASCTLMSYTLYTMNPETIIRHGTENLLYTVFPVTYGIFRYYYLVDSELTHDDAATSLTKDRSLQLAIFVWLTMFFVFQITSGN